MRCSFLFVANVRSQKSSDESESDMSKNEERKDEEDSNHKGSSNTLSDRHKQADLSRKASSLTLHRRTTPPNVSDASGTDTSRIKAKKKSSVSQHPQPRSRPVSPSQLSAQVSVLYIRAPYPRILMHLSLRSVKSALGMWVLPWLALQVKTAAQDPQGKQVMVEK